MADFGTVARSCSIIEAHGVYGIDTRLAHGGALETGVNEQDHFCNCLNPPAMHMMAVGKMYKNH
jgi:hypothetical protein